MEASERPQKTENTETTLSEGSPIHAEPVTFTPGEPPKKPKTSKQKKPLLGGARGRAVAIALLVLLSVASGLGGAWIFTRNNDDNSTQKQQVVLKSQAQLISNIARTVGESVVSIEVTSTSDLNSGTLFGFQNLQDTTQQSAGTGIILTGDGLIITNRHVVPEGTQNVSVTLSDGTTYDNVKVLGRTNSQDSLDIAFLKIEDTKGKSLKAAQVGDSSKVNIGDSVVAIGNALGQFQNTVTSGIISGHGRSVQASTGSGSDSENLEDLFQTDAAINEGNSGGPLVNLEGQVIGINTAVAGNAQNIGFAIPINDVSGLIKSVKETGELKRPYLGVVYVSLTDDIAKQYNLSAKRGAYIPPQSTLGQETIISGSPADEAGLKEGDIITKINGTSIDENTSLTSLLGKQSSGDEVTLTVQRGDKQITIKATLGTAPTN